MSIRKAKENDIKGLKGRMYLVSYIPLQYQKILDSSAQSKIALEIPKETLSTIISNIKERIREIDKIVFEQNNSDNVMLIEERYYLAKGLSKLEDIMIVKKRYLLKDYNSRAKNFCIYCDVHSPFRRNASILNGIKGISL